MTAKAKGRSFANAAENKAKFERKEDGSVAEIAENNRLFVYGIFLSESTRQHYGMSNHKYATVPGYVTFGHHIVQAVKANVPGIALTGVTVDVDPECWPKIDALEGGYDRVLVETDRGEEVNMYVAKLTPF